MCTIKSAYIFQFPLVYAAVSGFSRNQNLELMFYLGIWATPFSCCTLSHKPGTP